MSRTPAYKANRRAWPVAGFPSTAAKELFDRIVQVIFFRDEERTRLRGEAMSAEGRGYQEILRAADAATTVEQNARVALAVSDEVVVLGKGTVVFTGPTAEFHRREQDLKGRFLSV